MPIQQNGNYTGLAGFDRKFEYFGSDAIPFRMVETYTYEVYDYDLTRRADLSSFYKTQFANHLNVFSGDLAIKSLVFDNSSDLKQDLIRFQKYVIVVESRSTSGFSSASFGGFTGSKLAGLGTAIISNQNIIESISDSLSFSHSPDGKRNVSHDVNMTLRTGNGFTDFGGLKGVAQSIAGTIFSGVSNTLSNAAFVGYSSFLSVDSRQYFSESFDRVKKTFNFSKKRSIEPFNSGAYNYSMSHSINYSKDGIFNIDEKILVQGKLTFAQADAGFAILANGSLGRCQTIISDYSAVPLLQSSGSLSPTLLVRTNLSKVMNIPALTVDGSSSFTNDPSKDTTLQRIESFNVNKDFNGSINIDHDVQLNYLGNLSGNSDNTMVSGASNMAQMLSYERNDSPNKTAIVYSSINQLTGASTVIARIKSNMNSSSRGKSAKGTFSYTNNPIYDTSILIDPYSLSLITGLKKIEIDYNNSQPKDEIAEYKVVNRGPQSSVLSYSYQSSQGSVSLDIKGTLQRRGNLFLGRYFPTEEASKLKDLANQIFLKKTLLNTDIFNYYMSSMKYTFDAQNNFSLLTNYIYTKKRRP